MASRSASGNSCRGVVDSSAGRITGTALLGTALLALASFLPAPAAWAAVGLAAPHAQLFYETGDNVLHPPTSSQELGQALAVGDFDGDGVDDLVLGIHWDDHGILPLFEIGQAQVRWGAAGGGLEGGVSVKYLWQGGSSGVDEAETDDRFGEAFAVGDFDHDGFDDLAVGIPGEDIGAATNAGAVEIRYGAANRFDALESRRLLLHEDVAGVPDQAGVDDRFGEVLAAGDLDGDTFADLLVGVPSESVAGNGNAGRLFVFYGSVSGVVVAGAQTLDENTTGIASDPFGNDRFSRALVVGDWNADGFADLAVGVDHWGDVARSGAVHVLYSNASGPNPASDLFVNQDSPGIADVQEEFDYFGAGLAAGDWNGDGFDDLAIAAPYEDVGPEGGTTADAGVVHVLFGSPTTVLANAPQYWSQATAGVPGELASSARFGGALAGADFDGDGFDDLAIGAVGDPVLPGSFVGAVIVLRGSATGPAATDAASWDLDQPGIPGTATDSDFFGYALAAGDFNHDGHADLAIGAPKDEVPPFASDSGTVLVLYGTLFADSFESAGLTQWSAAHP